MFGLARVYPSQCVVQGAKISAVQVQIDNLHYFQSALHEVLSNRRR
jgi:hypothetical protein